MPHPVGLDLPHYKRNKMNRKKFGKKRSQQATIERMIQEEIDKAKILNSNLAAHNASKRVCKYVRTLVNKEVKKVRPMLTANGVTV
jgi:transposase